MRQFRILLSLLLLISTPLNSAVAVTFPSTVPTGEITGGTFSQYFRNAVENPCPSNSYMIGFSGAAGSYMRPDCLTFSDISVYASGIIGGTEGYVTRFGSGGSGIVNSVIFETGGRIGFGTTTPAVELDIAGRIKIAGGAPGLGKILVSDVSGIGTWSTPGMAILSGAVWTLSGNDIGPTDFIGTLNAEDFRIFTNNSQKMVVNTIGNVGIGVSNPTARLEVNGQVKITGGSPGSGKLLVSDTAGLASWISPASLVDPSTLTFSGTDMYIPRFTSSGSLTDSTAYQSGSDLIINDVRVGKGSGNILDNTAVGTRTLISNTTGNKNTALGYEALKDNTTGNHNTALGGYSLTDNTTGIYNTAVGKGALISNTTGNYNIGIGNYALYTNNGDRNIAIGSSSMWDNTTGAYNTAIGWSSLYSNTIGMYNTAIGDGAMTSNTTADGNTALGYRPLYWNTTGEFNTANGYGALFYNSTGSGNVANGAFALYNSIGDNNTALGRDAGRYLSAGNNNIFIGANTQSNISDSSSNQLNIGNWIYGYEGNIGIGVTNPGAKLEVNGQIKITGGSPGYNRVLVSDAAGLATWQTISGGSGGVVTEVDPVWLANSGTVWRLTGNSGTTPGTNFVGTTDATDLVFKTNNAEKLRIQDSSSNLILSGAFVVGRGKNGIDSNVALGGLALANTTGAGNTGLGHGALYQNSGGINNVAVGIQAMTNNSSASNNTAVGGYALQYNTTGNHNSAFGIEALWLNNTGSDNTALGAYTLYYNKASYNTAIGSNALINNINGEQNVALGAQAGYNLTGGTNNILIGYNVQPNISNSASNQLNIGNWIYGDSGKIGIGVSSPSYGLDLSGSLRVGSGTDFTVSGGYLSYKPGGSTCNAGEVLGWNSGLGAWVCTVRAQGITGSGLTTDYVTKWNGLDLVNSQIFDTATGVGIGTSSPGSRLEVAGQIKITGGSPGAGKVLVSDSTGLASWSTPSASLSGSFWSLSGNAITPTQFIGSTNAEDLIFKTSNIERMRIRDSDGDVLIGTVTLGRGSASISSNIAFGTDALKSNVSGVNNTAIGNNALTSNTIGAGNMANGANALAGNTSGNANTAIGLNALQYNTIGYANLAVGWDALKNNDSGYWNTAVGVSSLVTNDTGYYNTALGFQSLFSNTTGYLNTANGANALFYNTTGRFNTAIGPSTLISNIDGDANTAAGYFSLYSNVSGARNTANGYQALFASQSGSDNTAIGYLAGTGLTTGSNNIAIGSSTPLPSGTASNQMNIGNAIFGTNMNGSLSSPAGNIGIGTTTPGQRLTVSGGTIQIIDGSQGSGKILTSDALGIASWQTPAASLSGAFWSLSGNTISPTQFIGSTNNEDLRIWTNNSQKMVITSDGKVGIGVSSPSYGLDLSGSLRVGSGTDFTVSGGYLSYKPGGSTCNAGEVLGWNSGLGAWVCTVRAQGITGSGLTANYVPKWNGLDLVNSATYDNGTNVGIGTTSPGQKLTVSGGTIQIINGSEGSGKVLTSDTSGIASWQTVSALYTETDPIWSAASGSYYTKTEVQTSGQAAIHFANLTNVPGASTSSSGIVRLVDSYTGTSLTQAPTANAINNLKNYTDALVAGLSWKQAVRVATTGNISLTGLQNIDGYITTAGDRVLVKNQTTATENGIYIASAGAWSRATDADSSTEFESMAAYVSTGGTNQTTGWVVSNPGVVTLGATNITYSQFSGNNAYIGANPIQISGNTISILQANTTQSGYLSPTDYTTFNNKFGTVTSTGGLKAVGTTALSLKDCTTNGQILVWSGAINGWTCGSDANGVIGGQVNYSARWLTSTTLGTGALYDNGTNVGIGSTSPGQKLTVSGGTIQIINGSEGSGKILTSDVSGVASWTSPAASLSGAFWSLSGNTVSAGQFIGSTNNEDLRIRTNNIERMVVGSGGNIGIGTSAPASPLQVVATNASEGIRIQRAAVPLQYLSLSEGDGSAHLIEGFGSKPLRIKNYSTSNSDGLEVYVNGLGTPGLVFTRSGSLAIGLTSPSYGLDLSGSLRVGLGTDFTLSGGYLSYKPGGITCADGEVLGWDNTNSRWVCTARAPGITGSGLTTNYVTKWNGTDLVNSNLFATSTGVGIGTTSPSRKFTVFSDGTIGQAQIRLGYDDSNYWDIGRDNGVDGRLMFKENGTERITFKDGGNLGIGTTSPGQKLTVSGGTIQIIDGNQGAGKVLASDASGVGTWQNASSLFTAPVTSVFGRTGAVIAQSGDYNTSQVTENTNLYFTNARAIAAPLTGFVASAGTVVSTDSILQAFQKLQGTNTLQDTNIATATGQIATLQTNLNTATGNIATITGQLVTINSNIATATGDIATLSGSLSTIRSNIATATGNIATITGQLVTINSNIATATGNISTLSGRVNTLSGVVDLKADINSPLFTGDPRAPTPTTADSDTSLATTAFVKAQNYLTGETDPEVGSNTTNYLSKWNGSALITSQVFDNGTNVGIGTASPSTNLTVSGSTLITGDVTVQGRVITDNIVNRTVTNVTISGSLLPDNAAPLTYRDIGSTTQRWNNLYLSGQITLGGGSPGLNKILTSDANGLASWVTPASTLSGSFWSLSGNTVAAGQFLGSTNNEDLRIYTNNTQRMVVGSGGNVGIGTGNLSTAMLTVAGDISATGRFESPNSTYYFDATNGLANFTSGFFTNLYGSDSVLRLVAATGYTYFPSTAGNIGIGTSAPGYTLDLSGSLRVGTGTNFAYSGGYLSYKPNFAACSNGQILSWDNTNSRWICANDAGSGVTINGTTNYVARFTGASTLGTGSILDTGTGVSIGSSSVLAKFYVNGSTRLDLGSDATGDIYYRQSDGTLARLGLGSSGQILTATTGAPSWQPISATGGAFSGTFWGLDGNNPSSADFFGTLNNEDIRIRTNNTQRMVIGSGGNVGIGTTSPGQKLTVSGGTIQIIDGTQGAGKILTSDASGVATWQTPVASLSGAFWSLSGNVISAGQFIGSTNNADVKIYSNNIERMVIGSGGNVGIGTTAPSEKFEVSGNIKGTRFIGYGAGNISTNSAVGEFSLANNNTGAYNTANGNVSLYSNTVGSYNTANGYAALYANTGGTDNTALGVLALTNNLSNLNTAVGASSLRLNTIGVNNTALGGASLFNNNTGSFNVSLGAYSLYDQTQGSLNTAIGYNTARGITTGSNNTILGSNVTGLAAGLSNNVIIADGSGNRRINVDSSGNVGIGTTTTASGKLNVNADYYDLLAGNYNVDIGLKSTTGGWARAFRVVNTAGSNGLDGGAFGVYGTSATPERVYMAIPTANETGYDSTKIIALNNAGNVGIGTVSPGQKLDVDGNIRVSGASNRGLEFYSGASYGKIGGTSAGPAIWTADSTLGARFYDGALYFNGNAYFKNDVDSAFNMTILDTGNVGIGTTSPGQKLTVSGGTIQIIDGTQGAGKILTSDASGIATWQTPVASLSGAFWSLSGNVISAGQFIGSTNNADVKIYSNNTERMVIGSGGNVGIGIINPSAKLQVGGSTRLDLGSDATGDIFYRSSGGNLARLPAGSSGQILASSAGLPTWQTAATYLSGSFPVISVFGRTGAVLAGTGDYAASQITSVPSGSIASTNVQAALNELDSEKQALITGGATSITSADLTASRALASSSTGKVSVATTTLTELNFLTGATANIQSQLDQKAPLASPLFTGDPRAPTPTTADSDTSLATTAFVKAQNYLTGETDPIWSAASGSYYTKTNVQTSGQAAIHFANLTNVPVASTTASGLVQLVDSYTGTSISQAPTANAVNNLKNYTDALVAGLSWKQAVRVATTANIALSGNQSIDGYTTVTGDRVLVKNQTIATENGIYIAAAGAWSRATDSDSSVEFESMAAYVSTGTTNKTTGWVLANEGAIVLNTTSLAYAQFSGANSYIGSAPIQITGNTISILQSNSGQNGYLSSADFNTFNAKQAFISTGTTLEYYRGDKTFQTLDTSVVPENTNLYFTNARAQSAMTGAISAITNTNLTASRALASDASGKVSVATTTLTELNYLTGATGNIQTQINTLGTNVNTATGNIAIATGVLNMTPVFKVDMIANGTPPARTTSTGFVNVQYVYGPFSPSYSQPTCPAGTTKQYKFYAEFVDNITAPGGQNVAFRIALDGGTNIDISAGYTWGGSTSFRTYLSGFFTTSDTNHGFLQVRVNGSAGPYVEVRNAEIWTYCTQ